MRVAGAFRSDRLSLWPIIFRISSIFIQEMLPISDAIDGIYVAGWKIVSNCGCCINISTDLFQASRNIGGYTDYTVYISLTCVCMVYACVMCCVTHTRRN